MFDRYSRQKASGIGSDGQKLLSDATVAIVGCGALGSMVAMQLAGAGVGHLVIIDFDTIDISNLQRQFFFTEDEASKSKSQILKKRITSLNSSTDVKEIQELLSFSNINRLLTGADIVVDATDNPDSKFMIDNYTEHHGVAGVFGGVAGFRGQVMSCLPGSVRYREIFPDAPSAGMMPCAITGVVGPAAAMVASIQSSEAIKIITGKGTPLINQVLTIDLLENRYKILKIN